jgi:hypothetical protein
MYTLRHPRDPCRSVKYGGSLDLGLVLHFYAGSGVVIRCDRRNPDYGAVSPVTWALDLLAMHGYVSPIEIQAALDWVTDGQPASEQVSRQVKRAARVIGRLGELAGWG